MWSSSLWTPTPCSTARLGKLAACSRAASMPSDGQSCSPGDEGIDKGDAPARHVISPSPSRCQPHHGPSEDVLVLYSTSHGVPNEGLVFKDAVRGARPAESRPLRSGWTPSVSRTAC